MALVYYVSVSLIYLIAIPFLLYLSFKKKYKQSIPSRFFLRNNPRFKNKNIWFHACSLGEVVSLEPLIQELGYKDIDISVTTQTGFERARQIEKCDVRYLPFEVFLPFWVSKHRVLVVTEAELWPMLFCVAKDKGAKTILINARISDNSYSGYKKFSWFYRWIFSNIDVVFAQSEIDKSRLQKLGAKDVRIGGNIKTYMKPLVTKAYTKPHKRVIILASTHEGEEEMVLKNLEISSDDMVLVVPRHPERFVQVERFLVQFTKDRGLNFSKLSIDTSLNTDIVLCDLMGELVNLYAISDIVILCGSFKDGIGGHNPLEAAYFNNKIISGKYVFNQKVLFEMVENIEICEAEELRDLDFDTLATSKIKKTEQMKELMKEIK